MYSKSRTKFTKTEFIKNQELSLLYGPLINDVTKIWPASEQASSILLYCLCPWKRLARPPHCVTSFIDGPIWFEVQFQLQVFPVIIQLVINFVSTSCENFPGKNIHNHHPLQRNKKVFLIFSILLQFTYLGPRYFKIQCFKPD